MARYVIDAPTLLHLVAEGVVVHADHQLVAPQALRSRALGLLFAAVVGGELDEREALARHEALTEVKVRLLGDRVSRRTAWRVAREQGWDDLHDAEHVAITQLQGDALVSVDPRLRERAAGIVEVADVGVLARPDA